MSWSGYIPGDLLRDAEPPEADPREARLPKWAQAELARLRRELRDAERTMRELRADIPDADTFASLTDPDEDDIPLPVGTRVEYQMDDRGRFTDSIRAYVHRDPHHGTTLYVQGDRALSIEPRAANTFHIRIRE